MSLRTILPFNSCFTRASLGIQLYVVNRQRLPLGISNNAKMVPTLPHSLRDEVRYKFVWTWFQSRRMTRLPGPQYVLRRFSYMIPRGVKAVHGSWGGTSRNQVSAGWKDQSASTLKRKQRYQTDSVDHLMSTLRILLTHKDSSQDPQFRVIAQFHSEIQWMAVGIR